MFLRSVPAYKTQESDMCFLPISGREGLTCGTGLLSTSSIRAEVKSGKERIQSSNKKIYTSTCFLAELKQFIYTKLTELDEEHLDEISIQILLSVSDST